MKKTTLIADGGYIGAYIFDDDHAEFVPFFPYQEIDMAQAKLKEKEPTISDVAREAYESSKGDVQKATDILARRVRADANLYRELLDGMVESACYSAVRQIVRNDRSQVWNALNYDAGGNGDRVKLLAAGNTLMFFTLPSGKALAHATGEEVGLAADFYSKQSKDMAAKAKWLYLVQSKCTGEKTVSQCVTEEKLAKLHEIATNDNN